MQQYIDKVIPSVNQFFDEAYRAMPRPAAFIFVNEGDTGATGCTNSYSDQVYFYCPGDQTIYLGQRQVWLYYDEQGDAAPVVGLAHEWGHHVQNMVGVPTPVTLNEKINHENQADCIAGAWLGYASDQGWLNYPDDIVDVDGLVKVIASAEGPGRDHGTLSERLDSLLYGLQEGLTGCNAFYPATPVIN